jgi:hypothetical protein
MVVTLSIEIGGDRESIECFCLFCVTSIQRSWFRCSGHEYHYHRYLMTRLSLQVVYLWRHVLSTAPAIYIMVVKFRNTIWPPPPQLSLHRKAALSNNSNGTRSYMYSRENPKRSLYCEMSVGIEGGGGQEQGTQLLGIEISKTCWMLVRRHKNK